ncbi:MAG: GatB/YqeY domain-containing protein, partial [Ignavibacterium sp.]
MNLKERINNDLKEAMKSGDKVRLNTVRSIRALILEFEKSGAKK